MPPLLSFKNVGVKTTQLQQVNAVEPGLIPIGIKTPLQFGQGVEFFAMHYAVADQINDNLRNLIQTNHGERLSLWDFGANLQPLTAEYTSQEDFNSEAMLRINTAVLKWMPFVELQAFGSTPVPRVRGDGIEKIKVLVEYSVPRIGVFNAQIEVTLYVF